MTNVQLIPSRKGTTNNPFDGKGETVVPGAKLNSYGVSSACKLPY